MSRSVLSRRYQAYLFDLDGTLVDSAPDINAALNHALRHAGYPGVDEALTRHWVGHGARVLLEQALQHHGRHDLAADAAHLDMLLRQFIDYYSAHLADLGGPYPGVPETLQQLKSAGAGIAVVTNKLEGLSRGVLAALRLSRHVDLLIGGDSLPTRKPDPAPALHALFHFNVAPTDALFVGDSATDVATARAAGCAIVCVRDGYNHGTPAEELGADAVVDSLLELL